MIPNQHSNKMTGKEYQTRFSELASADTGRLNSNIHNKFKQNTLIIHGSFDSCIAAQTSNKACQNQANLSLIYILKLKG